MNVHDFLYYIILPILSISSLLVFVRFFKGPSIVDRVVALDLLITIGIGIIAIYSVISDEPTFLDISLVLASYCFF